MTPYELRFEIFKQAYNFANDNMDLDVTFSKKDVMEAVNKDVPKFDEFLKERYSSRDGFNSFTSNIS